MEILSVWVVAALALVAVAIVGRSQATRNARIALLVTMAAAGIALARPRTRLLASLGPRVAHDDAYVGSGACRACHPSEHASWSRTYHRTMTQRGTPPVAITTGSHHMQGYWTEDDQGALHMLPVVFARDEGRLIPRRDAFLEPPDEPQHDVRWTSNCIACHATGGRPNIESSRGVVAELGIACEACHGPGRAHADHERNPLGRWLGKSDAIVNPVHLPPDRASAVCGSCHAYSFPRDEEAFLRSGYVESYKPGDTLEGSRILLTPAVLEKGTVQLDTDARNLFWPDGTVRVGGREYNAMILSSCYVNREGDRNITCMSCHSMHRSDPDDQLRKDRTISSACLSCHAQSIVPNHTHHAAGSGASACESCHMPKTSYALRTAIRSHRIDSPTSSGARPNACNLCHLDRSLTWAETEMARLWGSLSLTRSANLTRSASLTNDAPASVIGLLSADAAERVVWADAFGDREAIAASGSDWELPVLERAAQDPYAVIRFIAERSMKGYAAPQRSRTLSASLVPNEALDALVRRRDNRPVTIAE